MKIETTAPKPLFLNASTFGTKSSAHGSEQHNV